MENETAKKRMRIMLICLGILFGGIFLYKMYVGLMIKRYIAGRSQLATVSTMKVDYASWPHEISAAGSLRAMRGVNVTSELAGMVQTIYFTPGIAVKQDDTLVQLKANSDIAQLHALQANAELAAITYKRDKAQYAVMAISKATLDADAANVKNTQAQVAQQTSVVNKKTIRAPFSGRLGISAVNPGQYINPGDKVVTLQQLDPIYVDFFVPQQTLAKLSLDQSVHITVDTFPNNTFEGKITTINPIVEVSTRNVEIEATIDNPELKLIPGMFASVKITTEEPQRYLTLPQAAISFNPYGDVVFVVDKPEKDKQGNPILTVTQRFVTTGETRGDQTTILKGLSAGEEVVTSGQLKLKNGSQIEINNSVTPDNNVNAVTPNEH